MIDKRVNKPRSYLPPMVVVLDVRLPRRIVIREILPVLERGPRQKQRALIKFLNGKPTLSTKKKIDYCDNLGDEELIQEVALRQKRYWGGKICIFFTADQNFYKTACRSLRRNPNILLVTLPLCGRPNFSRRQVSDCLKERMLMVIHRVYLTLLKKKGRAAQYLRERPEILGLPHG